MSQNQPIVVPPQSEEDRYKIIEAAMAEFVKTVTGRIERTPDAVVQIVDGLLRYAVLFSIQVTRIRDEPKTELGQQKLIATTAKKLLRNLLTHIKAT